MKRALIILACIIFGMVLFASCVKVCDTNTTDEGRPEMNVDIVNGEKLYNGQTQYFYELSQGQSGSLDFSVTRYDGELSVMVYKENGELIFSRKSIQTDEFSLDIDEVGEYKILFTADNFKGDFSVKRTIK